MRRQQIGHFVLPFAYVAAGVILILGFTWIAVKSGIYHLVESALEAE